MPTFNTTDYVVVQQSGGPINAQIGDLATYFATLSGGGGGTPSGWTLVASTSVVGSPSGGTSSAINTTGANLIVTIEADYQASTSASTSDSKSNSWSHGTTQSISGQGRGRLSYVLSPTVGSGHTFTYAGGYGSLEVMAFTKGGGAPVLDQQSGATSTGSTAQPGSITPTVSGALIIAGLSYTGVAAVSINNSFVIPSGGQQTFVSATAFGSAIAYLVQTTAAAINPTWTADGGNLVAVLASFK